MARNDVVNADGSINWDIIGGFKDSLAQKVSQGDLLINVKDSPYGAKGDGTTDDTTAIQNAVNYVVGNGGKLFFPKGTYKITNYINIPFGKGFIIEGLSRGSVTIKQSTDNKPIFRFTTAITYGWKIRNIDFEYANTQPVTNTLAVPIYFALDSGTGGAGYFNFEIENCTFNSGYYGISQRTDSQQIALWQVHIKECSFGGSMSGGAIYLSPSPAVGQPIIHLEKLYIDATNMQYEAINISSSDTVILESVEFNNGTYSVGGHNQLLISACTSVILLNCRSEVASVNGSGNVNLWVFSNSNVELMGCTIGSLSVGNGTTVYCINAYSIAIRGFLVGGTLGTGSTAYAVYAGTFLVAEGLVAQNNFIRLGSIPKLDIDNTQVNKTKVQGDVSVTLSVTDYPYQYFNTNLTANRTVTLPNTGLYDGLTFTIISRNTAAFTLTIADPVSAKNTVIPASTKARVTYRAIGSNEWLCTDYSTGIA